MQQMETSDLEADWIHVVRGRRFMREVKGKKQLLEVIERDVGLSIEEFKKLPWVRHLRKEFPLLKEL